MVGKFLKGFLAVFLFFSIVFVGAYSGYRLMGTTIVSNKDKTNNSAMAANVSTEKKEYVVPPSIDEQGENDEREFTVLLCGTDESGLRTDTMVLASVNGKNHAVKLLSIPRDTRVKINGKIQKINAAHAIGGDELTISTVKKLLGVPINYYATINFDGFGQVIDALGGVELDVPIDMKYEDPYQDLKIDLKKGFQVLDGDKAEQFMRFRDSYADGDNDRIKAQQTFFKAFIEQKLKLQYITKINTLMQIADENMTTNITYADVAKYTGLVSHIKAENLEIFTLPGESAYLDNLWFYVCDQKATDKLMKDFTN